MLPVLFRAEVKTIFEKHWKKENFEIPATIHSDGSRVSELVGLRIRDKDTSRMISTE